MKGAGAYFDHIEKLLKEFIEQEASAIDAAVDLLYQATLNKNNLFVFGASHAGILSQELAYRAGGLATINPIFDSDLMLDTRPITYTSQMERLEGFGRLIAENTPFKRGDVLLAHSVSGRNTVMIDLVQTAREKGVKIIGITNLDYSKNVDSRHPSGKRLFELSDVVIDNHGDKGDAALKLEGMEQKVGPTSTVIGAAIVNSITVELSRRLLEDGHDVPILYSANLDGGYEHNQKIFNKFKDNIFYL